MSKAIKKDQVRALHDALMDIVNVINEPQRDEVLVREAGISLDRALFPLLVRIERQGPIGVVELADRAGRDYTTVSRQLATLENLGLIARQASAKDKRIREAVVTREGKAMTNSIDRARERIAQAVFSPWDEKDVSELIRLMRKFADAVR